MFSVLNDKSKNSTQRVSLVLTILAISLWALSIARAKLVIGFYGLISSYSVIYFIALGLLTVASFMLWVSKENHGKLLCLQLSLFITMLWLTPILIGGNPISTMWTYSIYYPNTDYVIQTGHINQAQWTLQNWPGAFIVESAISQFTGASTVDFMAHFSPLLMQFLILPSLYLFFKNTIPHANNRWAGCWVFYLANWTAQLYLSQQALGIFLLVSLLALFSSTTFWRRGVTSTGYSLSGILFVVALAITHLLTSIAGLVCIAILWIARQIKRVNLLLFASVVIAFWTLYGATTQLEKNLPLYLERAFNLELVFKLSGLSSIGKANASFVAVTYTTYIFTLLIGIAAFAGFLISRRLKDAADRFALSLFVPPVVILFSMLYGSEFWARAYLFALVPIAYFTIKLLRTKVACVIFVLFLLIALPLNIISNYGAFGTYYQPAGETAYWHFEYFNSTSGNIIGGTGAYYPGYAYASLSKATWNENTLMFKPVATDFPQYVHVGDVDIANYDYTINDASIVYQTKAKMEGSPNYSLIYSNPNVNLYFHQETS